MIFKNKYKAHKKYYKFAILPTMLTCGDIVWLECYIVKNNYSFVKRHLSNGYSRIQFVYELNMYYHNVNVQNVIKLMRQLIDEVNFDIQTHKQIDLSKYTVAELCSNALSTNNINHNFLLKIK